MPERLLIGSSAIAGVVAALLSATPAAADMFDIEPDLRFCAAGMIGGFASGLDEQACRNYFALPSNYLFVCARGVRQGFSTTTDRAACVSFFERQVVAARSAYVKPAGRLAE